MRKLILAAALASTMTFVGCDRMTSDTYVNASGSVAMSRDDALVYAVDTDNEMVAVIDTASQKKVAEVKVGAAPETIAVGKDDTLYVANRGGRSVSVIARGEWKEAAKIPVGVEPVGLAVSPDGKTLFVVNATSLEDSSVGTLMAIDTASRQVKWDLPVGNEPRGITLIDGGKKALITLFKEGEVVQVDVTRPEITRDNTKQEGHSSLYQSLNKSGLENQTLTTSRFHPRAAGSITASPDGTTAYSTVVLAREDDITTPPNTFGGYYASGGPCGIGSVATAGIVTYDAVAAEPQTDDLTACAFGTLSQSEPFPTTTLTSPNSDPVQGPVASVVDPTGSWLFVLNRESENVAIMPTSRRGGDDLNFGINGSTIRELVRVGKGANGIAISRDGKNAYIYNQFDHTLSVLTSVETSSGASVSEQTKIVVANDVLPMDLVEGRKLFFSAREANINNPTTTGVSCNTCHTEGGREDGHVWGFPDGKRQTPSMAGRMMTQTAPFHWSGEFPGMKDFMDHTARMRMGGQGLTATQLDRITVYMDSIALPDNPHKLATLTEPQARGHQVFQQAGCATCHSGAALTNNANYDVGVKALNDKVDLFNTPSLHGIARTAPYLHDGSAQTLRDRITNNPEDKHGVTSNLSEQQVDDLVAYLKTL